VEVRDRIEELDATALAAQMCDRLAQGLGDQPVLIHCDVYDTRLVGAEDPHGADVARRLGENHVARIDEELRDEIESLLRSGRGDDVVDRTADPLEGHDLENVLTQGRNSLTRAVLQGSRTLRAHDALHRGDDELLRKRRDERHAACQRDDLGTRGDGEESSDF
jgi:hypothetical protein